MPDHPLAEIIEFCQLNNIPYNPPPIPLDRVPSAANDLYETISAEYDWLREACAFHGVQYPWGKADTPEPDTAEDTAAAQPAEETASPPAKPAARRRRKQEKLTVEDIAEYCARRGIQYDHDTATPTFRSLARTMAKLERQHERNTAALTQLPPPWEPAPGPAGSAASGASEPRPAGSGTVPQPPTDRVSHADTSLTHADPSEPRPAESGSASHPPQSRDSHDSPRQPDATDAHASQKHAQNMLEHPPSQIQNDAQPSKNKNPRCEHLRSSGKPCKRYAMNDSSFCYQHDPQSAAEAHEASSRGGKNAHAVAARDVFLDIGDSGGVQAAIDGVLRLALTGTLSPARSASITRLLSLAVQNLRHNPARRDYATRATNLDNSIENIEFALTFADYNERQSAIEDHKTRVTTVLEQARDLGVNPRTMRPTIPKN